ncbi:MAG TPA: 4Fe-4S ferredoxin, partial [Pirellulaceae bacterium]
MTGVSHAEKAATFLSDRERARWHDQALWHVRMKRDAAARSVPDWESLRTLAAEIKQHTLSRLDEYLEQFEREATRRGAIVHWARHAQEHNRIVAEILNDRNVRRVVKSKS